MAFRFVPPIPREGTVSVQRFWEHDSGGVQSMTEIYGPNGLVSGPAQITGLELSEAEAQKRSADHKQRMDAIERSSDIRVENAQRSAQVDRERRLVELAGLLGVDADRLRDLL